jgi:hypothetical protein
MNTIFLFWRFQCHARIPVREVALAIGWFFLAGCAFDVSRIRQQPASLDSSAPLLQRPWTLQRDLTLNVGSGFPTTLKVGTHWIQVGRIPEGDVFRTKDQFVEVRASNNYEACVVLNGREIVGFYLPVEGSFTAVTSRVAIEPDPAH